MKLKNGLIVICLILFILISISAVSAADDNTDIISTDNNDNDNVLSINNSNDKKVLTAANDGSFADLNTKINNIINNDNFLKREVKSCQDICIGE